jgi:hypothetical protein
VHVEYEASIVPPNLEKSSQCGMGRCYGQMNYTKCKSSIQSARKCGRCSMDLNLAGHVAFHIFGGSETPNTRNNLK